MAIGAASAWSESGDTETSGRSRTSAGVPADAGPVGGSGEVAANRSASSAAGAGVSTRSAGAGHWT